MKKVIFAVLISISLALACTSAVISASASENGRPLLWKHRDTGALENKLVFIDGNGYSFTGIANVKDTASRDIWMGVNETGFAVMNTASYNINEHIPEALEKDTEGRFMRLALETCASVDEFETLLRSSSGEWGLAANFGVIDALGNAAYFETGYDHFVKYDVNNPETAPDGYLIRTNFSVSGNPEGGQGYIRYDATRALFAEQETFTPEFIIGEATRNLGHGALKKHIGNMRPPRNRNDRTLVAFQDYIVRYWSASATLIEGVRPDENPENSVLWTVMGFPLTSMVTPVFFGDAGGLPDVICGGKPGEIPLLAKAALELKGELFPLEHDDHENYLDLAKLKNRKRDGYLQIIEKKEKAILEHFYAARKVGTPQARTAYYKWLDAYVREVYRNMGSGKTVGGRQEPEEVK